MAWKVNTRSANESEIGLDYPFPRSLIYMECKKWVDAYEEMCKITCGTKYHPLMKGLK